MSNKLHEYVFDVRDSNNKFLRQSEVQAISKREVKERYPYAKNIAHVYNATCCNKGRTNK